MAGRLLGKRALVYGGGTGIGYACAEAFVREGAAAFISSRRADVLRKAADRLTAHGRAGYAAGDATSEADIARVTAAAASFLGGIDTIVVSAGAGGKTPIFSTTIDEFQRIIDQNLRPLFLSVRTAAPQLLQAGSGAVIAIASMYALVGQYERVAYCGANHGAGDGARLRRQGRARQRHRPRLHRDRALARHRRPGAGPGSRHAHAPRHARHPPLRPARRDRRSRRLPGLGRGELHDGPVPDARWGVYGAVGHTESPGGRKPV